MNEHPTVTKYIFLFLCLFLWGNPVSSASEIELEDIQITVKNNNFSPNETRKIIPFKKGQKLSTIELEEEIKKIEKLDFIEKINYKLINLHENKKSIEIEILEALPIRDIGIQGNYPFLDKELRRALPIKPGHFYSEANFFEAKKALNVFLRKHGYYNSEITITPKFHKKYNLVDLSVVIKKGVTYRVEKVFVEGNTVLSDKRITNIARHYRRFNIEQLKIDLKKIKEIYFKKGFIKARIKIEKIKLVSKTKRAEIFLKIRENKKFKLVIQGKPNFSTTKVKKVLNIQNNRSYDGFAIKSAALRLLKFYRQNGYLYAKVDFKIDKTDESVQVTFDIDAGERVNLTQIKFVGNKNIGTKKLRKEIYNQESTFFKRSRFSARKAKEDQSRIMDFYKQEGFFDAAVSEPQINDKNKQERTLAFEILEGQEYKIRNIILEGDSPFTKEQILKKVDLKPDKPWDAKRLTKAKADLLELIYDQGYAYTQVEFINHPHKEDNSVTIVVRINKGKKVKVREIIIKGDHLTKEKTILKNIKFKRGDLFSYQKLLDSQLNLRKLGIFSTVLIQALGFDEQSENIDLLIFVQESKSITINVQGGFDNRNLGRGELSFTKKNLFGRAKQINLRGVIGPKFSRAETTFSSPRIFGTTLNLSNQYFFQYENAPNFNAISYGTFIGVLRNFGQKWTLGVKEQVIRTNVDEANSNVALLGNSLFDNTFNEFETFAIFDSRDNFSDPKNGFYVLFKNTLSTDLSDAANNFDTAEANISHHIGFLKRFTFNNTVRYGYTFEISSQPRIPVNKLFFLGGADTIRGFSEDALNRSGGTVSFVTNSELHFSILDTIKLAGFFDTGFLEAGIPHINWDDFRESAGFGLRYFTPIGPIRLDYGMILDRRTGEPKYRIHFSFGYFF